ncbi:alkaline phosphatase family protein [Candidatus Dependentiae bacterium]|nr:alkaline phosphatase family protein [Candidatus Dependentiae bacterium]
MSKKKVFVIGLDCATPQIVFEEYRDKLPNLNSLMTKGCFAKMNSTIPAITVPAWSSMMSGRDPGELGFYGFRNRKDRTYENLVFANSSFIKFKRVWDYLTSAGKKSIVLGVPQTYPPSKINGYMVSSFLTPDINSNYTYPTEFKDEVKEATDGYMIDVDNFRTDEKERLLQDIFLMTEKRFKLVNHMLDKHDDWDFFMFVEMGVDRIHHAFWKYFDKNHPKFEPGNKFENSILDYYIYLDKEIGQLLKKLDDDTTVIVISDHGAQSMIGGICINEWLIKNDYLSVEDYPSEVTRINRIKINWKKTKAWGFGGYYGRIFLNVKGREPDGVIPEVDYEKVRDELIEKFESMTDEDGKLLGTKVFKPEDIYQKVNNIAPDLLIYFGNLTWRSVGSLGLNQVYTYENDTGPDDANHAQHGIFIGYTPGKESKGDIDTIDILDLTPSILKIFGLKYPENFKGKAVEF